jgi:hypothetical protein
MGFENYITFSEKLSDTVLDFLLVGLSPGFQMDRYILDGQD